MPPRKKMNPRTGNALFLTGDDGLDNVLRQLPFRVQGRILRTALREPMEPVLADVQEDTPKKTGKTAKRWKLRTGKPKKDGSRSVAVGIFGKATETRKPGRRLPHR